MSAEAHGYSVGTWSGLAQYHCAVCSFEVVNDLAAMLEHIAEEHGTARQAEAQPVTSALVFVADKRGNEIKPIQKMEEEEWPEQL